MMLESFEIVEQTFGQMGWLSKWAFTGNIEVHISAGIIPQGSREEQRGSW
jgi:hypothetical protein